MTIPAAKIRQLDLIEEYLAAYRAHNPDREPPRIGYAKGWFTFVSSTFSRSKHRKAAVIRMRDTLLARENKQTSGTP